MSVYRIAEININIQPKSDYVRQQLSDFAVNTERADFDISLTREDIRNEQKIYCQNNADVKPTELSVDLCESLALYRKICRKITMDYNGILMHGAIIRYKGNAHMFTAPSGTGKTTHIRLWKKYFGDEVEIVNGDKPILREKDGIITAYGTPWNGKENYGSNISAPLKSIFLLKRGKINTVKKCNTKQAVPYLLSQTLRYKDEKSVKNLLDFIAKIIQTVNIYELECNMELSAVETSLSVIDKIIPEEH